MKNQNLQTPSTTSEELAPSAATAMIVAQSRRRQQHEQQLSRRRPSGRLPLKKRRIRSSSMTASTNHSLPMTVLQRQVANYDATKMASTLNKNPNYHRRRPWHPVPPFPTAFSFSTNSNASLYTHQYQERAVSLQNSKLQAWIQPVDDPIRFLDDSSLSRQRPAVTWRTPIPAHEGFAVPVPQWRQALLSPRKMAPPQQDNQKLQWQALDDPRVSADRNNNKRKAVLDVNENENNKNHHLYKKNKQFRSIGCQNYDHDDDNNYTAILPENLGIVSSPNKMIMMPPPPPRRRFASSPSGGQDDVSHKQLCNNNQSNNNNNNNNNNNDVEENGVRVYKRVLMPLHASRAVRERRDERVVIVPLSNTTTPPLVPVASATKTKSTTLTCATQSTITTPSSSLGMTQRVLMPSPSRRGVALPCSNAPNGGASEGMRATHRHGNSPRSFNNNSHNHNYTNALPTSPLQRPDRSKNGHGDIDVVRFGMPLSPPVASSA